MSPATICKAGRTEEEFKKYGTGDALRIQNGTTPDSYITVPRDEAEVTKKTKFILGQCFYGMGKFIPRVINSWHCHTAVLLLQASKQWCYSIYNHYFFTMCFFQATLAHHFFSWCNIEMKSFHSDCLYHFIDVLLLMSEYASCWWLYSSVFVGNHYWYDIRDTMDCDDTFPVFLLYNKKRLNAFGWAFNPNYDSSYRWEHPSQNAFKVRLYY